MNCSCGQQLRVIETRDRGDHIYRRHQCACGKRWTSYERLEGRGHLHELERRVDELEGRIAALDVERETAEA